MYIDHSIKCFKTASKSFFCYQIALVESPKSFPNEIQLKMSWQQTLTLYSLIMNHTVFPTEHYQSFYTVKLRKL